MNAWHAPPPSEVPPPLPGSDVARACALIARNRRPHGRTVVGIAGPPGSGKSTLAAAIVDEMNRETNRHVNRRSGPGVPDAALLAMDGFHLDNALLDARGLLARKGAPETFDAVGFCRTLGLLARENQPVYAARFDRARDLAVANAVFIHPATPVVVVEGTYLLLRSDPWRQVHQVFAATIFLCPAMDSLRRRLKGRWIAHGFSPQQAAARCRDNDMANAVRVLKGSAGADLVLTQGTEA